MNRPFDLFAEFSVGISNTDTLNIDFSTLLTDPITSVLLSGVFSRRTATTPLQFQNGIRSSLDQCTRLEQGVAVEGYLADLEQQETLAPLLDGGDVIPVSSPLGSYADLFRQDLGDSRFIYQDGATGNLPLPAPDSLQFDVPGAQFPAATGIRYLDIAPIELLGAVPFESLESPDFSWTPTPETSDYLLLTITSSFRSGIITGATCFAADDGSFTMPDWVVQGISSRGTAITRQLIRRQENVTVQNNALFITTSGTTVTRNFINLVTGE